ncbi:MAG: hypothetical protein ACE3JP_00035 [Ectobacillus sp.]
MSYSFSNIPAFHTDDEFPFTPQLPGGFGAALHYQPNGSLYMTLQGKFILAAGKEALENSWIEFRIHEKLEKPVLLMQVGKFPPMAVMPDMTLTAKTNAILSPSFSVIDIFGVEATNTTLLAKRSIMMKEEFLAKVHSMWKNYMSTPELAASYQDWITKIENESSAAELWMEATNMERFYEDSKLGVSPLMEQRHNAASLLLAEIETIGH